MCEQNFSDFISPILESAKFDWFALLGYVYETKEERRKWQEIWAETDPDQRFWRKEPVSARDCFQAWQEELDIGSGNTDCLWLEQERLGGEVRFYVLVADWQDRDEESLLRWKEISGGWAYRRILDERIAGFLGHMVMRAGCILGVDCGTNTGRYTSANFRPWRSKTS
jgi:hypothetical protein